MLPVLRADFAVCETYQYAPGEPLACPISAFAGASDPLACPAEVAAWAGHTEGSSIVRVVPGAHFFLKPARSVLLRAIADDLLGTLRAAGRGEPGEAPGAIDRGS